VLESAKGYIVFGCLGAKTEIPARVRPFISGIGPRTYYHARHRSFGFELASIVGLLVLPANLEYER
jgi:hypothetical protein